MTAAQRRRAGNVDQEFLRDFILYARTHVAPEGRVVIVMVMV